MEKMFKRLLSFAVALVMVLGMVPAGNLNVLAVEENAVTGLSGAGTEADPYLINNLEELIWFRDSVDNTQTDGSNMYLGKYFKLTADIDLAGINWNPIGENADHGAFKGNFDGGDHTIFNLYVEQAGSELGFFARTSHYDESLAPTTIKNLTFQNVTVKSTNSGTHVGGVIGNAGAYTYLDNVKVTGTVDISGRAYVGGIVGHGYPKINNCHVEATGSVACTYWCSGGIVGYGGEGGTRITNSSITGTGDGLTVTTVAGGAAAACGMSVSSNYFENISATNVDIVSLGNGYNPDYCLGYLVGNGEENCVLKNLTYTDVTLTAGDVKDTPTDIVVPELPTATVSVIKNENLTFAMNFKADTATQAQLDYYGDWYADYVLTINKDVTFNANGGADGYLSGQYDAWSANWVNVPFENVTLEANKPLKIMEYAAELMNKQGLKYTYAEVYNAVKDFDCGVFFTEEFLAANPDLEVTLELRMFNYKNEEESYVIGDTYVFRATKIVAKNKQTEKTYATVAMALSEAKSGETVHLMCNAPGEQTVFIANGKTLDLNGYILEADYLVTGAKGASVTDSSDGKGLLKIAREQLTMVSNAELPIWDAEANGYRFANVAFKQQLKNTGDGTATFKFYFTEELDGSMKSLLAKTESNGLKVFVRVGYTYNGDMKVAADFEFKPEQLAKYADLASGVFALYVHGLEEAQNVTFTPYVAYSYDELDIELGGTAVAYN